MTDTDRLRRISQVLTTISADMEADTQRREGQPFDGKHVAAALGEISATIAVIAEVVRVLVDDRIAAEVSQRT